MSTLKPQDPFSIEPIGDMFQSMLRAFRSPLDGGVAFKVDVSESDKEYTVKAELPGVRKEDIEVAVDRGTVTIATRTTREAEQKQGERLIRRERYTGSAQRSFTLDAAIDESRVDAAYENGVLTMTLPKKEVSPQQKISIR